MHGLIREACAMVCDTVVIKEMIDYSEKKKKKKNSCGVLPAVNDICLEGKKHKRPQSFALPLTDVYIGSSR